jgi:hypothetical protein
MKQALFSHADLMMTFQVSGTHNITSLSQAVLLATLF